ncbi:hypothetical protein HS088_TW08G00739 [Tripterygium wilfordii]|uniref:RING-type E3 ubiquitin transferase n=1 Tax=Tripterygium wilfordii TaxID=458696 RepID=A0A7J7DCT3_TRIWF|nr:hypothetical protein HS088_TW08G00739 [Tripterygium wilfordii]
MKFCKQYQKYMQGQEKKLPVLGLKKLKGILKKCRRDFQSHEDREECHGAQSCPQHCPVCDGTFFPSLLNEMSEVVGCFNERARKLLELHLASGFQKCFIWFKGKLRGNHGALIQEGKDLVTYAVINAIAIRKILKKYDKDTVFDPVSLTCGHIFCYMCACSASSVTIVDGLKAAEPKEKCPLCREAGVYEGAVHLEELNILLSRRCPEYWEQRLRMERVERVQQAKEHWESQCRAFMGV